MRRSSRVFNRIFVDEIEGREADTVTCNSDFSLDSSQVIKSTGSADITILPGGTGITIIGDAGSASRLSTPTNDDLFVSGRVEIDGNTYLDGNVFMTGNMYMGATNASCYIDPYGDELWILMSGNAGNTTDDIVRIRSDASSKFTGSSVVQNMLRLEPDYNQSATAGYRTLFIDIAEDAIGSGQTTPIEVQVDGNVEFQVWNDGAVVQGALTAAKTLANAQMCFYIDEGAHDLKCDVKYSDGTAKTATIAFD